MKICLRLFLLSAIVFLGNNIVKSQTIIHTTLPYTSTCPDTTAVPVNVENLTNVGSISLSFSYDTNSIHFIGYQNVNPALSSSGYFINSSSGHILFSWFSLNAANIGNGILFEILFYSHASTVAQLSWDTLIPGTCVYTDIDGTELESTFHDGSISNLLVSPDLLIPPDNSTSVSEKNIQFTWVKCGCNSGYEFQLTTDSTFQQINIQTQNLAVNSYIISILDTSTLYFWRVRAGNEEDTSSWSGIFRFTTKGPDAIFENGNPGNFEISNLFAAYSERKINFCVHSGTYADLMVSIYDLKGLSILNVDFNRIGIGETRLWFPTGDLPTGQYIIIFDFKNSLVLKRIAKKFQFID